MNAKKSYSPIIIFELLLDEYMYFGTGRGEGSFFHALSKTLGIHSCATFPMPRKEGPLPLWKQLVSGFYTISVHMCKEEGSPNEAAIGGA